MSPDIQNACEQIDAAFFSGDEFLHASNRRELRYYINRWRTELNNLMEVEAALLQDEKTEKSGK